MPHSIYILRCADDSLYTGYTNNLTKRLKEHNAGKAGAKYTRARRPVKLVYSETASSLSAGLRREAQIKKLSRAKKLFLIGQKITKLPNRASDQW